MINIPKFHPNDTNSSFFFVVNNHVVALGEHIKQLQKRLSKHRLKWKHFASCWTGRKKQNTQAAQTTYRQIVSGLEQVIWVEDPFVVRPQMGANSFAWSKAHFDGDLGPAPLLADCIEAAFFIHELEKREFRESGPQM